MSGGYKYQYNWRHNLRIDSYILKKNVLMYMSYTGHHNFDAQYLKYYRHVSY